MKVRDGFVSNSSSSSFTCKICGEEGSGWDASLSDFDMCSASDGETICCDHVEEFLKDKPELKEAYEKFVENDVDDDDDDDDGEDEDKEYYDPYENLPEKFCPLFNLSSILDETVIAYLTTKLGTNREAVEEKIRTEFKNKGELDKYVGKKK